MMVTTVLPSGNTLPLCFVYRTDVAFRTIAGFGPGVVYMAVKDGAGVVHLERARVK